MVTFDVKAYSPKTKLMKESTNKLKGSFGFLSGKQILILLSLAIVIGSCKEGPIGPVGPVGPPGADGAPGQTFENYLQTFPESFTFTSPFSTTASAGSEPWSRVTVQHYRDGVNVNFLDEGKVKSGITLDNGTSTMAIAVDMPRSGICQFEVSIGSEPNFDYLKWFVDGTVVNGISGTGGPFVFYFELTKGAHTIEFKYIKDASGGPVVDGAKLDNILITNYAVSSRISLPDAPVLPATVALWSERPLGLSK